MVRIHLSRLLGDRKMTQADLARMTEIRPGTINDWFHEMTPRINLEHLDKICQALDCQVSELLEYVPVKQKRSR